MAEAAAQPGVVLGRTVIAVKRSLVSTGVSHCNAGRRLDQVLGPDHRIRCRTFGQRTPERRTSGTSREPALHPVMGDYGSAGDKLTVVIEEDDPVAQQAPAPAAVRGRSAGRPGPASLCQVTGAVSHSLRIWVRHVITRSVRSSTMCGMLAAALPTRGRALGLAARIWLPVAGSARTRCADRARHNGGSTLAAGSASQARGYGRFAHATSASVPIGVTSPDSVAPSPATWRAGTDRGSQDPRHPARRPGCASPRSGSPATSNHRSRGRPPPQARRRPASLAVPAAAPRTPGPSGPARASQTAPPEVIRRQAAGRFTPSPRKISQNSAQSKVNQAVAAHRISHTRPAAAGKQSRRSENCRNKRGTRQWLPTRQK